MPTTCEWQLKDASTVFFSGETIEGNIILTTTSPKDIKDVRLIIKGQAEVKWTETETRKIEDEKTETYSVIYKSSETYIDKIKYLSGPGTLPVGTHTYTFLIHLPITCPTSCNRDYGSVSYYLGAIVNKRMGFAKAFYKPITVIKTNDLNANPILRIPLSVDEMRSTCCWSCNKGKIFATLKIPHSGYTPGQTVNLSLHLQNQSMSDIKSFYIKLIKTMSFTAHTPRYKTRDEESIVFHKTFDKTCLRLSNQLFEENFKIPATIPSSDVPYIIKVEYHIDVYINTSGCCMDMRFYIPICIGTKPFRESSPVSSNRMPSIQQSAPDVSSENTHPSAPLDTVTSTDLPPSYSEMSYPSTPLDTSTDLPPPPPPSYTDLDTPAFEKAAHSSSTTKDTDSDKSHRKPDS